MNSKEAIERLMAQAPSLTYGGYFDRFRWPREERAAKLAERRNAMLTPRAVDEFDRACEWLQQHVRTKNVNRRAGSSYRLKHLAERKDGYISNGMLIAAAMHCGFKLQRIYENAYINISGRWLKGTTKPKAGGLAAVQQVHGVGPVTEEDHR